LIKKFLLSQPRFIKRTIVIFLDVAICVFTVWLSFGLRLDEWYFLETPQWRAFIASIAFSIPLFFSFGLYQAIFRYVGSAALSSMAKIFISYTCLYFCLITLVGIEGIPRSIGVIQPILLFLGISSSRYFIRYWLSGANAIKGKHRSTALIYGAGTLGRQLAMSLEGDDQVLIKGFIDDDPHIWGHTINGLTIYSSDDVPKNITRLGVTDIILALPSNARARWGEIINALSGLGVRVRKAPKFSDIIIRKVGMSDLHDLDMNDLLGRKAVEPNIALLEKNIRGKNVLVTGAGGSIGAELCRQIIKSSPRALILIDANEHALYSINEELKELISRQEKAKPSKDGDFGSPSVKELTIILIPCLASVRDKDLILKIFTAYHPAMVFHAAAYKHVPLVEENPSEGIMNNVFGTLVCAQACLETGVSNFVLISTDKAVRPTNVMGASKRIAELVVQAMSDFASKKGLGIKFSMVRFGNVLGSSGSVAPLFSNQIQSGGPITVTHPEVTRYFMTIPEAAQLVIQSSSMATGGDVFVLDMGDPVRIYDLAVKMIYLSGFMVKDESNPQGDIEIRITGLRPGEKLYEELLIGSNPQSTNHPKIMKADEDFLPWVDLKAHLDDLKLILARGDIQEIRVILKRLVIGYNPS
jgi:FlaA1/EpsC-like NDP-sugar epimerase